MADDASLERFLAAAAPLRTGEGFDPVRAFQLLSGAKIVGGTALSLRVEEALGVGVVAIATPSARNAAVARYALERVAIAVEELLQAAVPVEGPPLRRGLR